MALRVAEARGERPEAQSLYHDDYLLNARCWKPCSRTRQHLMPRACC